MSHRFKTFATYLFNKFFAFFTIKIILFKVLRMRKMKHYPKNCIIDTYIVSQMKYM